jgi:hypothetical protein
MRPVVFSVLVIVTYFVSTVGGDGSQGWSLRSFFSSFLAFFSISLFRFFELIVWFCQFVILLQG